MRTRRPRGIGIAIAVLAACAALLAFLREDHREEQPSASPRAALVDNAQPPAPTPPAVQKRAEPPAPATLKRVEQRLLERSTKAPEGLPAGRLLTVSDAPPAAAPTPPGTGKSRDPDSVLGWGPWAGQPDDESSSTPPEGTPHAQGFPRGFSSATPPGGGGTGGGGNGGGGNGGGGTSGGGTSGGGSSGGGGSEGGGTPPPPPPIVGMPPGKSGHTPRNSGPLPPRQSWEAPPPHPHPPG